MHAKRWLRYSAEDTTEGRALHDFACYWGLQQLVREPTRENPNHLLDLVLTDVGSAKCTVLPRIADHKPVWVQTHIGEQYSSRHHRQVWHYASADWSSMQRVFASINWSVIDTVSVDAAAEWVSDQILSVMSDYIPKRKKCVVKDRHPWLNGVVRAAIKRKHNAIGGPHEKRAAEECSCTIQNERVKFYCRAKTKLSTTPRCSKKWWKSAKRLLDMTSQASEIPPLREQKKWYLQPQEKADLFARTFQSKNGCPESEINEYSDIGFGDRQQMVNELPSNDKAKAILRKLNKDSATGPDLVPARILHFFYNELAEPISRLARQVLLQRRWPKIWRSHWIIPLYKKKEKYSAGNYRGVHLTSHVPFCV